jgi:hypothetical protein
MQVLKNIMANLAMMPASLVTVHQAMIVPVAMMVSMLMRANVLLVTMVAKFVEPVENVAVPNVLNAKMGYSYPMVNVVVTIHARLVVVLLLMIVPLVKIAMNMC